MASSPPPLSADDLALLDRLAARVVDLRLETPAILTLETGKPLALLASQAMIFFEPIAQALFPGDQYRRYATYCRNFGQNRLYKIACGANSTDYNWTEVLMRDAGRHFDGLSLHYYTLPGTWAEKGSATTFDEGDWFVTLKKALFMDELIGRHAEIMDRYDPERRVGLIVDEWGAWYDVEPGTPPGFLYQQNSLRDALVAGVTLNILNRNASRVAMANIAQTVNVLQAPILTDGASLILTPTYHVFEMYRVHQGAAMLPAELATEAYAQGGETIPALNLSASRDAQGRIHLTICNLDPQRTLPLTCELSVTAGWQLEHAIARVPA